MYQRGRGQYNAGTHLVTIFAIVAISSAVGAVSEPEPVARLMGSIRRESERERYATSNDLTDSRNIISALQDNTK